MMQYSSLSRPAWQEEVRVHRVSLPFVFALVVLLSMWATSASTAQDIPANSHRTSVRGGWECDRGFVRAGNECQVVIMPDNAVLDYSGHRWECKRGFVRVGSECQVVIMPDNA